MIKILQGKLKWLIVGIFGLLGALSIWGISGTTINYDLSTYLPSDSISKVSIEVIGDEFGLTSAVQVMVEDISIIEARELKAQISEVSEVKSIIWLDDIIDLSKPLSSYDTSTIEAYYKDECALFTVTFITGDYDKTTEVGIDKIKVIIASYSSAMRGEAISNIETRRKTESEIFKIILIILPIAILILILASTSWFEPVIILLSLGLAVLFNMGTNFIFPSVSFITFSISAILQLAISLDYSLFLIHRFYEERDNGLEVIPAVVKAIKTSFGSISTSAVTTIAGFLALLLMRYKIGFDIGIVMSKGVIFSYIACLIILPIFIVIFAKTIEKTKHKKILPSFKKIAPLLYKFRHGALGLTLVMALGGFVLQQNTIYYYGSNSAANTEGNVAAQRASISDKFGEWSPIVFLVPNDIENADLKEASLIAELQNHDHVISVQALYAFVELGTPISVLPEALVEQFRSDSYSQIIVNCDLVNEDQTLYDFSIDIQNVVKKYYDTYYVAGNVTAITDVQEVVKGDSLIVTLVSLLAVGFVLIILFRQFTMPVILVFMIQTSIWINFAIPYIQGVSLAFIGYLVISGLQLGATIDYAVLVGNRYREFRSEFNPQEAMKKSVIASSASVLVSTLILTSAGVVLGLFSSMGAIKEIGILIGRGAALSGALVLLFLGPILVLFDKVMMKENQIYRFKRRKVKNEKKENITIE